MSSADCSLDEEVEHLAKSADEGRISNPLSSRFHLLTAGLLFLPILGRVQHTLAGVIFRRRRAGAMM
jgi:hypothetical protein